MNCTKTDTASEPGVVWTPDTELDPGSVRSVCGVLGSFDPLHLGHCWIVRRLLQRFQVVALMVPAWHPSKTICQPYNATLPQRLELIERIFAPASGVVRGIASEVLFVRLWRQLMLRFPAASVSFGMGNDTHRQFLDSPTTFRRLGLPWGASERADFVRLRRQLVVFGRSQQGPQLVRLPRRLRSISSTRVRAVVRRLHRQQAPPRRWRRQLHRLVPAGVPDYLRTRGLYGAAGTE